MDTKERIKNILKKVEDPELKINIVDLGLIRGIVIFDPETTNTPPQVEIIMTLTTPFCPFANELIDNVEETLYKAGFENVKVELSFEPPWEPPEELRAHMGL